MYKIGWFSTGRDKAARDLIEVVLANIRRGEIKAELSFAFSNREPGEAKESDRFLALVKSQGIPLVCLSSQKIKAELERFPHYSRAGDIEAPARQPWRQEYDRRVLKSLGGFQSDLGVLAGYMLIVGEEMCRRYNMINLHPAAPGGPSGTWQEVIWKLIESRADRTGVMMHLVTPELDKGPPATYCTFSIRGKPFDGYWAEIERQPLAKIKKQQGENDALFKLIRRHGLAREFPLIVTTLKAFSEGRVKIEGGRVVDARGRPIDGYDSTVEIDEIINKEMK